MDNLFEQTSIKTLTLSNRLVRSATWEGMCEPDGKPTAKLADYYAELASGGIGLLISGYTFVRPEGKQLPGKMGIHTDAFADEFKKVTAAAHEKGGKIAIQLVHAGGQTDAANAGRQPLAPSAVKVDQFPETPAELNADEIKELVAAFAKAAGRAKDYGFDAVQLHGAHGYLINQFLSPLTNRRADGYGGSVENRCRFLMEVYEGVRETVGDDYPVLIKLNLGDNLEGGLTLQDALQAAQKLDKAGIDAIEVSSGTPASGKLSPARVKINSPESEAYNLGLAKELKGEVSCPVMAVGGFRSPEVAEKAVSDNAADYICLSRPLIKEPDLPNRWKAGDRTKATCISCNGCFGPGLKKGAIACVVED